MMVIKFAIATALLLVAGVCNSATIGIVASTSGEVRFHFLAKLVPNETVQFQYPDKNGDLRCCMRVAASSFERIAPDSAVSDAISGADVFSYKLTRPVLVLSKSPFVASALAGVGLSVKQAPGHSLVGRDSGQQINVSSCTAQEGVHVIGSAGKKVVVDLYFSLGYQVERANCKR